MVLTGLFSAEEAAAAPAGDDFYANLKQDIEVECKKAGELDKVSVFLALNLTLTRTGARTRARA